MTNSGSREQAAVYLRVLRRWGWLPILFGLVSAGIAYQGTKVLMKPVYGADTTLQVTPGSGSTSGRSGNDANTDSVLMTTQPVIDIAYKLLGTKANRYSGALYAASCNADANDQFITCSTTSPDYRAAAAALNALAQAFVKYNSTAQGSHYVPVLSGLQQQENQISSEVSALENTLHALQRQVSNVPAGQKPNLSIQYQITATQSQLTQDHASLSTLKVQESNVRDQQIQAQGDVHQVDPAIASKHEIGPHPARNAILGLILGFGVAAALIVLLEYLDDSFRSVDEIARVTGVNIIGSVARLQGQSQDMRLMVVKKPRSAFAEAYRVARTNLQFASLDRPAGTILVTSTRDQEGKTTTASNLAAAIAIAGRRVLLVDADLHRAGLTKSFELTGKPGLTTSLFDTPIESVALPTEVVNLHIVPTGPLPPNPAELLGSQRMKHWLEAAKQQYDIVVMDGPPVEPVADGRVLATLADASILVVAPSLSTRRALRHTKTALDSIGARVLGVIVNKGTFRGDSYYYYGGYSYGGKPSEDQIVASETTGAVGPTS